ncbi:hypothetical protein [Saccharothrix lopnurensis]|uniref:Uncharacterized protein n=1 Tax=Saccharothrix lopnurensis TaxID=1670621 RepID=A0ABW1P0G3_9PSEU
MLILKRRVWGREDFSTQACKSTTDSLLTCIWRPATAACQDDADSDDGPTWPRCHPTCANAARTDRDIAALREHLIIAMLARRRRAAGRSNDDR